MTVSHLSQVRGSLEQSARLYFVIVQPQDSLNLRKWGMHTSAV